MYLNETAFSSTSVTRIPVRPDTRLYVASDGLFNRVTVWGVNYFLAALGRFAPYLERLWLRLATP